jgi:hypothetical protein
MFVHLCRPHPTESECEPGGGGPPTGNLLQHVATGMYVLFNPTGLRYVCYWCLVVCTHSKNARTESYFRVWLFYDKNWKADDVFWYLVFTPGGSHGN